MRALSPEGCSCSPEAHQRPEPQPWLNWQLCGFASHSKCLPVFQACIVVVSTWEGFLRKSSAEDKCQEKQPTAGHSQIAAAALVWLFALQQHCMVHVPGVGSGGHLHGMEQFEEVAPPSAGQGDVSAAMISFASQKWQYFTDNPMAPALLSPLLALSVWDPWLEHQGALVGPQPGAQLQCLSLAAFVSCAMRSGCC